MTDETKFVLSKYLRPRLVEKYQLPETTNRLVAEALEEIESIAAMYGYEMSVQPRSKT